MGNGCLDFGHLDKMYILLYAIVQKGVFNEDCYGN